MPPPPLPPTHHHRHHLYYTQRVQLPEVLHALDAASTAALPDGLRSELEAIEAAGGGRHLAEMQQQVRPRFIPSGTPAATTAAPAQRLRPP